MYKRFRIEELIKINTPFLGNLRKLYTNERYLTLKEFLKDVFKYGNKVYFFESSNPIFRICKDGNCCTITDEIDKLELFLEESDINELHRILKDDKKVKTIKNSNKTILEDLLEDFNAGNFKEINDVPYLVYDIETIGDMNNLKNMKFILGYSVISNEDHNSNIKYRSVNAESLKKFVDFMLNFPGYIVGYNNIYFDNPVCVFNTDYTQEHIDILNQKSLDIFLFIWNISGRRLGLDKVAKALIGIGKTLASGMEGTQLLIKYNQTNDKSLLTKVQNYCKNDVKMTLGVLLYLLKYKKIYLDNEEISFEIDDMIKFGKQDKEDKKSVEVKGMFD